MVYGKRSNIKKERKKDSVELAELLLGLASATKDRLVHNRNTLSWLSVRISNKRKSC